MVSRYIAKTFFGLEEVLARELIELGANDVSIGRRMVEFSGDKQMMYRANFSLRTALRILMPVLTFKAEDADEVYEKLVGLDLWERWLDGGRTFAVDAVVYSEWFRHSKFVSYRVKDAIVDHFTSRGGRRPNVSVTDPDVRFHLHIADRTCTLCLDSSGSSLHRRGYRMEGVEAPLNEVLAAGMILLTGWKGECDFIDPMCGSGTLPIEAALIARGLAPGIFGRSYAFERWDDFDRDLFDYIYNDDSGEHNLDVNIYGSDSDIRCVKKALTNVKSAGLTKDISISQADFKYFARPERKSIMVMNPPYGERLSPSNLYGLYEMIGERLKHAFQGNDAWILSYHEDCFRHIGLKPSVRIPLMNGALECELRRYQLFEGKIKDFTHSGGSIKTDEERRIMSEKRRRKKIKEWGERQQNLEKNAEGDILSFEFHSLKRIETVFHKTGAGSRSVPGRGKKSQAKSQHKFGERKAKSTNGRSHNAGFARKRSKEGDK